MAHDILGPNDLNVYWPGWKGVIVSTVQTEQVLVVRTELFHQLGHFQGFRPIGPGDADHYLAELLRQENTNFLPRPDMEQDPSFKQLIPYVVFCHTGRDGQRSVFQYTRGTGQGEDRLHRKRSVGIGGHISMIDCGSSGAEDRDTFSPYEEGMRRELEEEVIVETELTERCVGLINDDETEVGRVHLGIVHLAEVKHPAVAPRESEIVEAGFRPVGELLASLDAFESWSQICLSALFGSGD